MTKSEIINELAKKYGFKNYLGISTPTTGFQDNVVDNSIYSGHKHLLVYNAPFEDSIPENPTYRTSARTSHDIVSTIRSINGACYDLVFVDPFHTYENSYEDILGGFSLLRPGGVLVVHDCNPAGKDVAAPEFISGEWCGLTYWAFINFVLGRAGISYYTVDSDYGCGVVFKHNESGPVSHDIGFEAEWAAMSWTHGSRYRFFDENRKRLLNLMSVAEFCLKEGIKMDKEYVLILADAENFDEEGYLAANADVALAVSKGAFPSGRAHFEHGGRREGRKIRVRREG